MPTPMSPGLLLRTHLLARLMEATHARLIVVNGEAGSGKTSLLAAFIQECQQPVAWYSLQSQDREEAVFLAYLCEALQRAFPGAGTRALQALQSGPAGQVWQTVAGWLLNDLARYGNRATIILDDYHMVDDVAAIAQVVEFLVRNATPNLQLIVASRISPHLPLAWLRSKNFLAEVSGADLRFSSDEIERVFSEVWNLPIDRELAELLLQRTEGWATGLQLVWQAVRARPQADLRSYLMGLGGKEQFIYDYLAAEVYDLQDECIRTFLKRTSIVTRFNLNLARRLSALEPVESVLQRLDEWHLFLVHLDSAREWFRYHHLFGEFLRRKLDLEDGAETVRDLHRVAGSWWEAHGDAAAAIEHFLEADEPARVVDLLEHWGRLLMSEGRHHSMREWLNRIPLDQRNRPHLNLVQGQLEELSGNWPVAVALYQKALDQFRQTEQPTEAREAIEALLNCQLSHAAIDRAASFCETALATCDENDLASRAGIASRYGAVLVTAGRDWDLAFALVSEAYEMAYKSADPNAIAWACVFYGWQLFARGSFMLAEKVFNEGIELLSSLSWTPMLYHMLMNKSVLLVCSGELERARELIEDTMAVAERSGQAFVLIGLEMSRAMLHLETGDLHRCAEAFARMTERLVATQIKPWYYRTLMLLGYRQQNYEQARSASLEMLRFLDLAGHGLYAPECFIALAWYQSHTRDREAALRSIDYALLLTERGRCRFWRMKASMVRASILMQESDRREEARDDVAAALSLTQECDYQKAWKIDPLGLTVPLLIFAAALEVQPGYARRLLCDYGDARLASQLKELVPHVRGPEHDLACDLLKHLSAADVRDASPAHIEIHCLGRLEVLNDGRPVEFYGHLSSRILGYLITHYTEAIPIEEIMDCFWPSKDGERAQHNLNVQLNLIRKAMVPELRSRSFFVSVRGRALVLQLDDRITLDLAEFDRLFQEGRQSQRAGNLDQAVTRFLRAEALCSGALLPASGDEPWLIGPRQRVAEAYRTITTFLADQECAATRWADAAAWYRKQLQRSPTDEPTVQSLLRCHLMMRDVAGARREFNVLCEHLRTAGLGDPTLQTRLLLEHPL
ncbi:MAG: BTAD domain-containing putative transcriptional regulator [Candidatus Xenobia bacterium]